MTDDLSKLRKTAPWLVVKRSEMTAEEKAHTDRYVRNVEKRCGVRRTKRRV